jgi:oxygen-dependent protoporphyrinogen oxidase
VVSALPLANLDGIILQSNHKLPHLTFNPSSTVTVVNLVFPCPPNELHPAGFGYLLPRPLDGYEGATGLGILGTVFDSCALSAQDQAGSKPITKLTVMCGGPYGSESNTNWSFSLDTLLDELFRRHFRRARVGPIHASVHKQVNCIPLPLVGHLERMKVVQKRLEERPWNGRLGIVGAGVHGAGISDCIKASREIALGMGIGGF